VIELIVANDVESITLADCGLGVGKSVSMSAGALSSAGMYVELSESISMKILARITSVED